MRSWRELRWSHSQHQCQKLIFFRNSGTLLTPSLAFEFHLRLLPEYRKVHPKPALPGWIRCCFTLDPWAVVRHRPCWMLLLLEWEESQEESSHRLRLLVILRRLLRLLPAIISIMQHDYGVWCWPTLLLPLLLQLLPLLWLPLTLSGLIETNAPRNMGRERGRKRQNQERNGFRTKPIFFFLTWFQRFRV